MHLRSRVPRAESREACGSAADVSPAENGVPLAHALHSRRIGGSLAWGASVRTENAMVDLDPAMGVTRLDRRLTAKDLDGLPHEWDTRYELIDGVLFMSRRPSFEHQDVIARVLVRVRPVVVDHGGKIVPEPGIVWDEDGEDNVSPDLAIVFGDVPPRGEKLRSCPQIVVEVLSQGEENRRRDLEAKRELYWRRGATEYWIIDPDARMALRHTRGASVWNEETLKATDVLRTPLLPRWAGVSVRELLED